MRGALRRLVDRERVTILVHPDDLDLVRGASERLVGELGGIEHCDVQAERRVARGGAIVRTVEGEVDATLATKLVPRARGARGGAACRCCLSPTCRARPPGDRLAELGRAVGRADLHRLHGRVSDLIGLIVEATGLEAEVGEVCEVRTGRDAATGGWTTMPAEVVGFRSGRTLLMPLGEMQGIGPGDVVTATGRRVSVATGDELLGPRARRAGQPDRRRPAARRRWPSARSSAPRPRRWSARGSPTASRSACARSTRSCPAAAASAWASSPARASASPRCWG